MSEPSSIGTARVVIVRHGETEWSKTGRHTGRTDLPLVPDGRRRAKELAGVLAAHDFERVLCSPLRRARETCELAGFGSRAELCDDLQEWDYGDYEGLTRAQILELAPGWSVWRDGCPGGEAPSQVGGRADRVLALLGGDAEAACGSVLVFAHGHLLRVLAARWAGLEVAAGRALALFVAGIGVLAHERETPVIERWNTSSL
ncbi:MAG: histidine phosphatase family protein [Solirubrobacteraceae bacterium]